MEGEIGEAVRRLSVFLPQDTRHDILKILLEKYDERKLARDLDCTLTSLRRWKNNGSLPDEHMSKILVLALQNCPKTRDLLIEISEEVSRLCKDLNISGNKKILPPDRTFGSMGPKIPLEFFGLANFCAQSESILSDSGEKTDFSRFMSSLDERSKEIVWYLLINRHAGIRELATLIHATTDHDVLTRVRDVINPKAREIFGKPMLNFKESKIDPFTGDKTLFKWWLTEDLPVGQMNDALDIFDKKDQLVVITDLPGVRVEDISVDVNDNMLRISTDKYLKKIPLFYTVENKVESRYKNGVLEIRLKKKW